MAFSAGTMEGYRFVNLHELARQMHCVRCSTLLDLGRTVSESLFGLASILQISCLCGHLNKIYTGKKQNCKGDHCTYEINSKASTCLVQHSSAMQNAICSFLQVILGMPVKLEEVVLFPCSTPGSSFTNLPLTVGVGTTQMSAATQLLQVPQHVIQLQAGHLLGQQQHPALSQQHPALSQQHPALSQQQQVLIIPQHKDGGLLPTSTVCKDLMAHTDPARPALSVADCRLCPPCPHNSLKVPGVGNSPKESTHAGTGSSGVVNCPVPEAGSLHSGRKRQLQQSPRKKTSPSAASKKSPGMDCTVKLTKDERDDLKVNTKCLVCQIVFRSREHFRMHRILHPQINKKKKKKKIKCSKCFADLADQSELQTHMAAAHSDSIHKCDLCDKALSTKKVLNQHVRRTHLRENTYFCHICDKKLQAKQLKEHLKTHKKMESTLWTCSVCEKSFRTKSAFNSHMPTHSSGHKSERGKMCLQKSTFDSCIVQNHSVADDSLNQLSGASSVKNFGIGSTQNNVTQMANAAPDLEAAVVTASSGIPELRCIFYE